MRHGERLRRIAIKLLRVLCVATLLLGVAGHGGRAHRFLELASHFKLQYLLASLVLLIIFIALRAPRWIGGAMLCAVLNASALAPWYWPPTPFEVDTARRPLLLLLSNVFYGNPHYALFAAYVREQQPDIVVCQEVSHRWGFELKALQQAYPHSIVVPKAGGSGIALLSRWPLKESFVINLGDTSRPSILATVDLGETAVSVLALHPETPLAAHNFAARNSQLAEAARLMGTLPGHKIIIGDLNTTLWSPFLSDLENTGMVNARRGAGALPSWPTHLPPFMRLPIDHCFVSPEMTVAGIRTGRDIGSDHLPLIVDVAVPIP
ncbi:MAG: endonuclease/exonuclease/phosphatase family protein [Pyrinomonadaceae bacterium]